MVDTGSTAWLLGSAALVMLMTPGLALFYGGMVRARSVLNVMAMTFICLATVGLVWVIYGYSLAFGPDWFGGLLGNLRMAGLRGLAEQTVGPPGNQVPLYGFVAFQMMFAIITVALLAGAIAERARFWTWTVFSIVWVTLVYIPVAHWVFAPDGWIAAKLHVLDFAGGTVVEVNSGAAALALALVLGRRHGWPKQPVRPHNLPFVMFGAGLLWFGWFGFNAGSALVAKNLAATSFLNTTVAGAAAVVGWLIVEQLRDGKPTTLGAASGAVAGLVGITPGCAYVEPLGAIAIGAVAGVACSFAVSLKYRFGFDDSLDVVAVHGLGGLTGTLMIGLFATMSVDPQGANGLFYGGGLDQLWRQAVGTLAVLGYSFVVTLLIGWAMHKFWGFRVDREAEIDGVDEAEHAEGAYELAIQSGRRGSAPAGGFGPHLPAREETR
ncbi:ammonium transporter [Amycolatopsis benzoatilytica]|uniref:ammonium transporter n=1 Tax=Amycolatopsis benzoatilytica TaxID=346045 RepID=UPI000365580A|nr:ammonium transporter [Amycolatopsis benzoatilytica]